MGGSYSTPAFLSGARYDRLPGGGTAKLLQVAGRGAQAKCRRGVPKRTDPRGWALYHIYGVPDDQLDMYPSTLYTLRMAFDDVRACATGRQLPQTRKVVRYDKISRGDPITYALSRVHGLTPAEVALAKKGLPYTLKMAQIDISTYAKRGTSYYKVRLPGFQVIDKKTGIVRDYRDKGFENKYRYAYTDVDGSKMGVKKLNADVERRLDLKRGVREGRYGLKMRGGRPTYEIPCADFPAMCDRGDKTFFHVADDPAEAVAAAAAADVGRRQSPAGGGMSRRQQRKQRARNRAAASPSVSAVANNARQGRAPAANNSARQSAGAQRQGRGARSRTPAQEAARNRKVEQQAFHVARQRRMLELQARVNAGNAAAKAELNRVKALRFGQPPAPAPNRRPNNAPPLPPNRRPNAPPAPA